MLSVKWLVISKMLEDKRCDTAATHCIHYNVTDYDYNALWCL